MIAASLRQAALDLNLVGARWALVGGFAVSARAQPRFTHDVDVCVLVETDEQAEQTVIAMRELGYSVIAIVEHEQFDRLATVRLGSPLSGGVLVDLLFASSGVETEIVTQADSLEILPTLVLPVARAAHLVVLKLLARDDESRPQDRMDLRELRRVLTLDDEAEVIRVAHLVGARGFNRERDMAALVTEYLATGGPI